MRIRLKNKTIYRLTVLLRFVLVLLPQLGYVHPDEFFQFTEFVAGDIFHVDVLRTWEFNSTEPTRSVVFPYIISGLPFYGLREMQKYYDLPKLDIYLVLVLPRLFMTLLSLTIDIFLKKLCKLYLVDHIPVLLTFSTSYVTLVYLTRTFTNSVEVILFSAVLFLTCKAFKLDSAATKQVHIPSPLSFLLAFICVSGFFNRPTFVVFCAFPLAFFVQFGPDKNYFRKIHRRVSDFLPGFATGFFIFLLCDTIYYRGLPDVLKNGLKNGVCTPCNFINYNMNSSNLAQHGVHPPWQHLLVNLPILFAHLGVNGVDSYCKMLVNITITGVFLLDIQTSMFICSFIGPILLLSLLVHQEPRFILPVIVPLAFLNGDRIWNPRRFSIASKFWLGFNLVMVLFYAFFHQGGIVSSALDISRVVDPPPEKLHLVFFHTYMPPRHLFNLQFPSQTVEITDLAGANLTALNLQLKSIFENDPKMYIHLFYPSSLRSQIKQHLNPNYSLEFVKKYPFHLSTENFPRFDFHWKHHSWIEFFKFLFDDIYNEIGLDLSVVFIPELKTIH